MVAAGQSPSVSRVRDLLISSVPNATSHRGRLSLGPIQNHPLPNVAVL